MKQILLMASVVFALGRVGARRSSALTWQRVPPWWHTAIATACVFFAVFAARAVTNKGHVRHMPVTTGAQGFS
ncbi:MAG: hypothetical protein ABSH38_20055 [Verrucomicrobiota bacterium]|jgi:hypothetical protein